MFSKSSPEKTLALARQAVDAGSYKDALRLLDGLADDDDLTESQTIEKNFLEARALRDQGRPGEARKRLRSNLASPIILESKELLDQLDREIGAKARDLEKRETRLLLAEQPRFEAGEINFQGHPFHYADAPSLLAQYEEFFVKDSYRFEALDDAPRILDCGANAGIATLYFKQLYPECRIVAFEPDPAVFSILEKNVSAFSLQDVELHNLALWNEEGPRYFLSDGADAGHIETATEQGNSITVECVRLSRFLTEPTEFLKIDIEGAEYEVLEECSEQLSYVRHIFIEYHSYSGKDQNLSSILAILRDGGFRFSLETPDRIRKKPYLDRNSDHEMDLRVHIFALR